ncbi:biopolymer transporter ExbD [Haloferula sp. BvORR071]|uniref:ExbD/TolR family protein n=1 Tax=Haloferula sp. BvORR071 TaxID=1396141 RepID=UPI00055475EF|nr:biopolymer transporter ExbD [Haloferula sp. BvORR071]
MKKKRSHRRKQSSEVNLGFQIAPMIDVVFVILLFFMVKAGDIQVENAHITKLPGTEATAEAVSMPDEISVMIDDDGQVSLNEDPVDDPQSKDMPALTSALYALKQSSEATQSKVLVTIYANELAEYQRVVDVLDSLTRAKISDVTFQAGAPE